MKGALETWKRRISFEFEVLQALLTFVWNLWTATEAMAPAAVFVSSPSPHPAPSPRTPLRVPRLLRADATPRTESLRRERRWGSLRPDLVS